MGYRYSVYYNNYYSLELVVLFLMHTVNDYDHTITVLLVDNGLTNKNKQTRPNESHCIHCVCINSLLDNANVIS